MSSGSFNTMKYEIISMYRSGGSVHNASASKGRKGIYSQLPGLEGDSFHQTWDTSAFLSKYSHLSTVLHPEPPPQSLPATVSHGCCFTQTFHGLVLLCRPPIRLYKLLEGRRGESQPSFPWMILHSVTLKLLKKWIQRYSIKQEKTGLPINAGLFCLAF